MGIFTFELRPGEGTQFCNLGDGWSVPVAIHNKGPNRVKLRDALGDREAIESGQMTIQVVENQARIYVVKEAPVSAPTMVLVEVFPPAKL